MSSFVALSVPGYRRLMLGGVAGEFALFAFETALFWTVLERTGSSVDISLLFIGLVLPMVLLTIPVGLLIDRVGPRRPLVLGATAASAVMVFAAGASHFDSLTFKVALMLSVLEGVFNALWTVPSQVLAGRVVNPTQLTSAIGLSAFPKGLGAVLGGLVGGLMLAAFGPVPTFLVSAVGLLLAAFAIGGVLEFVAQPKAKSGAPVLGDLVESLSWIRQSQTAMTLVGLAIAGGMFMGTRFVLFPALSRDVLGAGPMGLGLLTSAVGVGSILGSLLTDRSGRWFGRGRLLVGAMSAAGLTLAMIGAFPVFVIAVLLTTINATCLSVYQMTASTVLQVLSPIRMRGRALALLDIVRAGLVPAGGVVGSLLADSFGVPIVFGVFGGLTLATVSAVLVRNRKIIHLDIDSAGHATLGGERLSLGEG